MHKRRITGNSVVTHPHTHTHKHAEKRGEKLGDSCNRRRKRSG